MWKDSTGSTMAKMSVQKDVTLATPRAFLSGRQTKALVNRFLREITAIVSAISFLATR